MTDSTRKQRRRSFAANLKALLVQNVPDSDALCEFDCAKAQCSLGDWASCERRLAHQRALAAMRGETGPKASNKADPS